MNPTPHRNAIAWGLAVSLALAASPAYPGGFAAPNIQFLYGADYGDFGLEGGDAYPMLTLELANGWTYGDNFFFTDWNRGPSYDKTKPLSAYGELHSRLSFGKISGKDMAFGPVSDILLAGEVDYPSNFSPIYLGGMGFDLKIPGFAFAFVNVFLRDEVETEGVSFQINPVWMVPFGAGLFKGSFGGWIDVMSGKLMMGCEYEYFQNFLGINAGDVNHPQFVALWNL